MNESQTKDERRSFMETVAWVGSQLPKILLITGGILIIGLAFGLKFQLNLVATLCSGILAVTLSLYVFVRLWPQSKKVEETARQVEEAKALMEQVKAETKPGLLRVRKGNVKLSHRATKALAMTIKGMIHRDRGR